MAVTVSGTVTLNTCFSPLHEGDTSVAGWRKASSGSFPSFSPLHEGDTSVARGHSRGIPGIQSVSVPFTRGTPPWLIRVSRAVSYFFVSVPFTRGTPPWPHFRVGSAKLFCVSVPFTRGTPPWPRPLATANDTLPSFSPLHEGDTSVAQRARGVAALLDPFQSPSRGGHLRGYKFHLPPPYICRFSPLHEGDTSVAGPAPSQLPFYPRFSPLHEGDTSVAARLRSSLAAAYMFQSPSRGGHLRGTYCWHRPGRVIRFQSPSRGGHLRGEPALLTARSALLRFSPLHEGDTSVAVALLVLDGTSLPVSVPFTRGTPPWHLPGAFGPLLCPVSVPFTRGTPPWR